MQKQDRTFARTPTDLERKYNFAGTQSESRVHSEKLSQLNQSLAQFQALINARIDEMERKLREYCCYPVDSIHISVDNVNPSTSFGGEWELYMEGYFMIGSEQEEEEETREVLYAPNKCYVWQRIK